MIIIDGNELSQLAFIHSNIAVFLKNEDVYFGKLQEIKKDTICLLDSKTNLEVDLLISSINQVGLYADDPHKTTTRESLWAFRHEKNKLADTSLPTIAHFFQKSMENIINLCDNELIRLYFEREINGKTGKLTIIALQEYSNMVDKENRLKREPKLFNLAKSVISYRTRDYSNITKHCFSDITHGEVRDYLTASLFYAQMKDLHGFLFWMTKYLQETNNTTLFHDKVWWFYLRTVVQYAAYESIESILYKVAVFDKKLALESLAYLLSINNSTNLANIVLSQATDDILTSDCEYLVNTYVAFLSPDYDNNYHRYVKWLNYILFENRVCVDSTTKIEGIIYDFIPERKFGFILGYDLLSYFFRAEGIITHRVENEIRDNLCSLLSVKDESPVCVSFIRTSESKRVYNAIEIE